MDKKNHNCDVEDFGVRKIICPLAEDSCDSILILKYMYVMFFRYMYMYI